MPKKLTCTCPVHKSLRFVQVSHAQWEDERGQLRYNTYGLTADGVLYRFKSSTQVWVVQKMTAVME